MITTQLFAFTQLIILITKRLYSAYDENVFLKLTTCMHQRKCTGQLRNIRTKENGSHGAHKSDCSQEIYYFCHASATCAHKQVCGKSLIFFFHLPGTHLNTFSVQLLGPTLTHFFSLRKEKKVSI